MTNEIFEHSEYREFMTGYFKSLPREGFGQLTKAAKALNIQPSLLTGILNGTKNLTLEQAFDFAHYIELTDLESEYFIALVNHSRSGTPRMKKYYEQKLAELKTESMVLKTRIPPKAELPEQVKAQFYSEWFYSGIRMATALDQLQSPDTIAERLKLPRTTVTKVLDFLLQNGLVEQKEGRYVMGPQSTHIGAKELLVSRHHTNWRLKAIEKIGHEPHLGLHFTSPLTISVKDIDTVRKILTRSIDDIFAVVDPSPSEELACLNIDWFKI